jgi:hypothetical protein
MGVWRSARVAAAHDGKYIQPFSSFFTAVAGEKVIPLTKIIDQ